MKGRAVSRLGGILFGVSLLAALCQEPVNPPPVLAPPRRPPPHLEARAIPADWPGLAFTEVRAYLYNPGDNHRNRIIQDRKLHLAVENPEGVKLDAVQTAKLLAAIRNKAADGSGVGCFEPHHGFVFYDDFGKPVASTTVCFLCKLGIAEPGDHSMRTWDWAALSSLLSDAGLPVFESFDEAKAHFIASARNWPEDKLKQALFQALFTNTSGLEDFKDADLLRDVGERSQALVLGHLADKQRHADLVRKDPDNPHSRSPLEKACYLLGDTPPPSSFPLLTPFLEDAGHRNQLLTTIAMIGTPECAPVLREALAGSDDSDHLAVLYGLETALRTGSLKPESKALLFKPLKLVKFDDQSRVTWTKVLLGLDENNTIAFVLSDDVFRKETGHLHRLLEGLAESGKNLPRNRLLALSKDIASEESLERPLDLVLEEALRLLGRHRHPDDLPLLESIVSGDTPFDAGLGCPGLLAWHGLEDYKDRLQKIAYDRGYASLNRKQQLHRAVDEFASTANGLSIYFSGEAGGRWRDALEGAKEMHYPKLASLIEETAARFGEEGPAMDEAKRKKQLDAITAADPEAFAELEKKREALRWWVVELMLNRHAIANPDAFK